MQLDRENVIIGLTNRNCAKENTPSWKLIKKSGFELIKKKMYKDLNDAEEVLYWFYEMKKAMNKIYKETRFMKVELQRASVSDAEQIWNMQIEAFTELLEKYQDLDTNPGNEKLEKIIKRLEMPETSYYFIKADTVYAGAIRIVERPDGEKRISPLFVLPQFRNKGVAQAAISEAEKIHGKEHWALETILQEKGNCHLYEKMGYMDNGKREVINDKLTLILYYK